MRLEWDGESTQIGIAISSRRQLPRGSEDQTGARNETCVLRGSWVPPESVARPTHGPGAVARKTPIKPAISLGRATWTGLAHLLPTAPPRGLMTVCCLTSLLL